MSKTFEDEARSDWASYEKTIPDSQLQIGCLQRIATALEKSNKLQSTRLEALEKRVEELGSKVDALQSTPRFTLSAQS